MSKLDKMKMIPEKAGIYIFYDFDDIVLYVGTSTNLLQRIKNHFGTFVNFNPFEITKIRYWVLADVIKEEGLHLEKAFIKKYNPKYNLSKEDNLAKFKKYSVNLPKENDSHLVLMNDSKQNHISIFDRIKNKAHFIQDLVSKYELLGMTYRGRIVLIKHCKDLFELSKNS